MKKIRTIAFLLIVISGNAIFAQVFHPWEVITLSFESDKPSLNPYMDIPVESGNDLLSINFEGISGEAKGQSLTLIGFWSRENIWKVNFAAPCPGKWSYRTKSGNKGLNANRGSINIEKWTNSELESNATRNGFIQVNKTGDTGGHFFEYSDGKPFLWIGDTWWNWTQRKIRFDTFKSLVDDRAEKGFTVGQLFVPGNGWGIESSALDRSYSVLDTEHMQHIEDMIAYANSKGITVWVHAWWSRKDMNENIGEEKMIRWWRYLVHRLGAYNVIWVLAGEYNMNNNGGFPIEFWKKLGQLIDEEDPYDRIISLHNTPPYWSGGADAPQWSTGNVLHNESWLDYNQSQVGHGRYANEMIPMVISNEYKRDPAKPIVITEPWYEFIEGNPTGMDIRFAAWSAILSGAAGHTYGGGHVWLADVPESPSGGGPWPLEKGFERSTYDYEGAVSMKHLASFFKEVNWWNMSPHPELISDYPQPLCLAKPGEEYVIYLRYGGSFILDMHDFRKKTYSYYWYNPKTGKKHETISFTADNTVNLACPESYPGTVNYKDWVIHIIQKE